MFLESFVICFLIIFNVEAVEFRGAAVETYKGAYSKKKVNEKMQIAKDKACQNAFKKFVQSMESSKRTIFISIQDQIYANLSEYMVCDRVVDEQIDKKQKKVSVVMKANIDTTRLDIEINKVQKF